MRLASWCFCLHLFSVACACNQLFANAHNLTGLHHWKKFAQNDMDNWAVPASLDKQIRTNSDFVKLVYGAALHAEVAVLISSRAELAAASSLFAAPKLASTTVFEALGPEDLEVDQTVQSRLNGVKSGEYLAALHNLIEALSAESLPSNFSDNIESKDRLVAHVYLCFALSKQYDPQRDRLFEQQVASDKPPDPNTLPKDSLRSKIFTWDSSMRYLANRTQTCCNSSLISLQQRQKQCIPQLWLQASPGM